jgi:alcohol dehydrogenase
VHCLSESLGGLYDAPHGLLNATLLPYVMVRNLPYAFDRYGQIAGALCEPRDDGEPCEPCEPEEAVSLVAGLGHDLGLPGLASLGVQKSDFQQLAERAVAHGSNASNPKPLTGAEYRDILEHALGADLAFEG